MSTRAPEGHDSPPYRSRQTARPRAAGGQDEPPASSSLGAFSTGLGSSIAAVFSMIYDPAGRPALPQGPQLGHFRSSGSVETGALPIANNVELLARSVILNYLALHNQVDKFEMLYPNHGLGDLNQIVALPGIRTMTT